MVGGCNIVNRAMGSRSVRPDRQSASWTELLEPATVTPSRLRDTANTTHCHMPCAWGYFSYAKIMGEGLLTNLSPPALFFPPK